MWLTAVVASAAPTAGLAVPVLALGGAVMLGGADPIRSDHPWAVALREVAPWFAVSALTAAAGRSFGEGWIALTPAALIVLCALFPAIEGTGLGLICGAVGMAVVGSPLAPDLGAAMLEPGWARIGDAWPFAALAAALLVHPWGSARSGPSPTGSPRRWLPTAALILGLAGAILPDAPARPAVRCLLVLGAVVALFEAIPQPAARLGHPTSPSARRQRWTAGLTVGVVSASLTALGGLITDQSLWVAAPLLFGFERALAAWSPAPILREDPTSAWSGRASSTDPRLAGRLAAVATAALWFVGATARPLILPEAPLAAAAHGAVAAAIVWWVGLLALREGRR